jgi:amidophosphoribosyltransferase
MHNGHITNYLALRDRYQRLGYDFLTTNDSEVLSVLLVHELNQGASFKEALTESIDIVDGAMTYVAVTEREVGLVKDRWGYKPMVVAETDEAVVLASDGAAIVGGLQSDVRFWEPGAGSVLTWQL